MTGICQFPIVDALHFTDGIKGCDGKWVLSFLGDFGSDEKKEKKENRPSKERHKA